jgi:hypothetical protein
VPGGWSSLIGIDDVSLETGMIRAFHRHMANFCGQYPHRLKGPIVASTRDVDSAVEEIRKWGKSKWAVGCSCYHPLFAFNQFGDVERCALAR